MPQTLQDVVIIYAAVTGTQDGELREENYVYKVYPQLIAGRLLQPLQRLIAEHGNYPAISDVVGDFVYARLQKGNDEIKTCYPPKQLDAWAKRLQTWASGGEPDDLPRVDPAKAKQAPRDVFAYVIHEGKVRAPAGAMELIERVK